mmetsp:Transcript_53509/g.106533  ORF Transcript_53509/g.106533 Transcript_53509/m.106533 type:complete len:144 (-) Transcript_53509:1-432(-)
MMVPMVPGHTGRAMVVPPGIHRVPGRAQPMGKAGSEAMSLLQEMKQKQEQRERRRTLKKELDSLVGSGQCDLGRLTALRGELASVETFLAQVDGAQALKIEPKPMVVSPPCVREDLESANLYVGSLAPEWTEELMSREFGRFG